MTKQIKSIILLTATLAFAACSDDVTHGDKFTVGDADNAINLSIGVQSSPTALQSRAPLANHYAMQENTAINLYVEGDWTHSGTTTNIVKKSTYTAQKDTDADNINAISWKSGDRLYWDDFGTADPDNTANRTKGLGILAVAIDGVNSATSVPADAWLSSTSDTDMPWEVKTDGSTWFNNDLIVANNLYDQTLTADLKRYTFDEQKNLGSKPEEARLDFKHVLSRITFILKPGLGFSNWTGPGFWDTPQVYLTRNKTGESNPEWCYTKGKINILSAKATNDGSTLSQVLLDDAETNPSTGVVTETAIIYPGSRFGDDNDKIVAKIIADYNNVYYITAAQIRAAIDATTGHNGEYITKPGFHYIFNVTLNKTDIVVTATITDWNTVTADPETPEILPMATISWGNGHGTATDLKEFEFYSSYAKNDSYSDLATAKCDAGADGSTTWTFYDASDVVKKLYWPSHDTHLFFRGVSPKSTTVTDSKEIAISNIQYTSGNSASNLLIGMPEIASGTMCDNPDHTSIDMSVNGICARKEPINLNFRYMMSQVEVRLSTTTGDDKVAIGENTVVQLENIYSSGVVALGNRQISVSGSTGTYTLDKDVVETDADKQKLQRRSAIVPQSIGDDVRFKITVTNADSSTDVYYAPVNKIKESGTSTYISNWESGKHYIYQLTLKKTGLSVTATITDWTTVTGSDHIWF